MSRSRKKTPIFGHTGSISEAADKAAWHRRHRANERVGLQTEGPDCGFVVVAPQRCLQSVFKPCEVN